MTITDPIRTGLVVAVGVVVRSGLTAAAFAVISQL